jgi:hypothetical protein
MCDWGGGPNSMANYLPPTSIEPLPPREGSITAALQASEAPMEAPNWLRWRVGRKVGRTIYAMVGDNPSDDDHLIGTMDTPRLAEEAVTAHNATLERVQRRG